MARTTHKNVQPKGPKKSSSVSSRTRDTEDSSTTQSSTTDNVRKSPRSNRQNDKTDKPDKAPANPTKKIKLTYAESVTNQETPDNLDEDGDDVSMGSYRIHDYYITIKLQMNASPTYLQDLRDKYIMFINTLQEVDENLIIKGVNVTKGNKKITNPKTLPERNIGLNKYFYTTSKPPKADKNGGVGVIWATALICTDESFDELATASHFDLESEGITMMKKRLQCFKSVTPAYFQFVDNRADPEDIKRQIVADIGEKWKWILFNRKPWEGYNAKKENNKKYEYLAKCLHVECTEEDSENLIRAIRNWIKKGYAANRFGQHIKIVEELRPNTPVQQVDRTIRINGHGRRFQASIDMVELAGLINPNGSSSSDENSPTIREEIISRTSFDGEPVFLAVTKKWGSSFWQATYIKKHKEAAQDFASCPAAWLYHESEDEDGKLLFKHFTPDAVREARSSVWDEEEDRVITQRESDANAEEQELANISWLVDTKEMDDDSDAAVSFQSGVHFNFAEEISVKTTRLDTDSAPDSPTKKDKPRPPPSILRSPSDSLTVNSDITTESRLKSLESGLEKILHFVQRQPASAQPTQNTAHGTRTSLSNDDTLPVSSTEEAGE